jgi:multidrug efflux pump subunit AcrA (membrane-fusion protein)
VRRIWVLAVVLGSASLAAWAGLEVYRKAETAPAAAIEVPTTLVRRGNVTFSVSAKGELQGANSAMLTAPMAGGAELVITSLKEPGELVRAGETVAEFDTTELSFNLREAEADLAEADEQLRQAKAESLAREEEARYALRKAESDLRLAELEARRNDMLAAIAARQNELAVEAARDRLRQLQEDLASRKATTEAGIAIQEAAVKKSHVKAEMARKMIESMTLRAPADGYVSIQQNSNTGMIMWGMELPIFQIGNTVRPGMAVAQIPNLEGMQVSARISELDRGHLAVEQAAKIDVVATPGRSFRGRIVNIGNTMGPPWDRRFECKLAIDDPVPELRPGMSAKIEIVTAELADVLWLPSQALFDRDGQKFVYLSRGGSFAPVDVELVRSGESKVVVEGLEEGAVVALADPTKKADAGSAGSASEAITGR